jgi:NADPH:quinone reductase-like Zn-dependent oxidoreductase
VCVPQSALARMPAGMTYEEAACLPQAGAIALQGLLDKGQVQPGQKVLINGAGGGSGMYAVQLYRTCDDRAPSWRIVCSPPHFM